MKNLIDFNLIKDIELIDESVKHVIKSQFTGIDRYKTIASLLETKACLISVQHELLESEKISLEDVEYDFEK